VLASITRVSCAVPLPPELDCQLFGLHASTGKRSCINNISKSGASFWDSQEKPGLATDCQDSDRRKCTASAKKCHVVF
jgi:hypothetical protein